MAEIEVLDAVAGPLREVALELFLQDREADEVASLRDSRRRAWPRALDFNPAAGPDLPPKLWLARKAGRPVGVLLGVPFRGRCGHLKLKGHWGVDLYVPARFRGQGIGAAVLRRWRDESPLALGLGITDEAFRIELSLGWTAVRLPPRQVAALTGMGAMLSQRAPVRWTRAEEGMAARAGYEVRLMDGTRLASSDAELAAFDGLWKELEPGLPAHIDRDWVFLRWRFGKGSEGGWQWLSLRREGRPRACALFRLVSSKLRRKLWVYEIWAAPGSEEGELLVRELISTARGLKVDVVEGRLAGPHLEPWLQAAGFSASKNEDRFIVHAGPALAGAELERHPWYLTLSDSGNL